MLKTLNYCWRSIFSEKKLLTTQNEITSGKSLPSTSGKTFFLKVTSISEKKSTIHMGKKIYKNTDRKKKKGKELFIEVI